MNCLFNGHIVSCSLSAAARTPRHPEEGTTSPNTKDATATSPAFAKVSIKLKISYKHIPSMEEVTDKLQHYHDETARLLSAGGKGNHEFNTSGNEFKLSWIAESDDESSDDDSATTKRPRRGKKSDDAPRKKRK